MGTRETYTENDHRRRVLPIDVEAYQRDHGVRERKAMKISCTEKGITKMSEECPRDPGHVHTLCECVGEELPHCEYCCQDLDENLKAIKHEEQKS